MRQSLHLIRQGLLESAHALLFEHDIALDIPVLNELIEDCLKRAETFRMGGDIRASIQYHRRAAALVMLRDAGYLSDIVIPSVVLPEGYRGKIMLVFIKGDLIPERICLRSGDDWHREILKSFETEVHDFGFETFQTSPRGGAFAEFQADGAIVLFGTSEEFGRCQKEDTMTLIQTTFPERDIHWSDTAGG